MKSLTICLIEKEGTEQHVDDKRIALSDIAGRVIKQVDFIAFFVNGLFQVLELTRHRINNVCLRIHLFVIHRVEACIQSDVEGNEAEILHAGEHCDENER